MTFLLDTNACIAILNGAPKLVATKLRAHSPREICLSSVTKAELLYGARHSARVQDNLRVLAKFFLSFSSLPFDDLCAEHYGQIRADLEDHGQPIGPNALLIAAVARAHDLVLVTHDTREFSRIVGLRLEDWES